MRDLFYFSLTPLRRKPPRVVDIPVAFAPLCGLRLAFVTDVHMCRLFSARQVERLIAQLDSLAPDLILWGGDFAETQPFARAFFRLAARLKPRYGSFCVPGNNDVEHSTLDALHTMAQQAGIELLVNGARRVPIGTGSLLLIGLDEPKHGHSDMALLDVPAERNEYRVLLVHSPLALDALPEHLRHPPNLILCGHTHGGQIRPFGVDPYRLGYENTKGLRNFFVAGNHKIGDSLLLVSNGIGDSSIPLRLGAPPELHTVTFLTQKRPANS